MSSNTSNRGLRVKSLSRRKNGSLLQMIQTLQICSAAERLNGKYQSTSSSVEVEGNEVVFATDKTPEGIHEETFDYGDCADDSDDESFVSAQSSTFEEGDADISSITAIDISFETTPASTTTPRRTRRTSTSSSSTFSSDNNSILYSNSDEDDLARQIEAMALQVELAFEMRHDVDKEFRPRTYSSIFEITNMDSVEKVGTNKSDDSTASLSIESSIGSIML